MKSMAVQNKEPTAEQLKNLIRSSREILEEHRGTRNAFDGLHQELNDVERMVGDDSKKKDLGNRLIKLGVALFIFPEPVISNITGTSLIAAGMAMKGMNRNMLTIADLHRELHQHLNEINRLRKEMSSIRV